MKESPYRVLAISGSLRAQSSNTDALRAAAMVAPPSIKVTLFEGVGSLPHFNPDLDLAGSDVPVSVHYFRTQIGSADGLLICSPEYAHGVPGSLKNALDWLVSAPEMLYKPVVLLNISSRATYAYAALAETLRTMSTVLVETNPIDLPPAGKPRDPASIAAAPEFATRVRRDFDALTERMREYVALRPSLIAAALDAGVPR
ncbi:MAG TPA: NADPH-dependent FMN reductase [Gemmatimonadaceae bacterium]